MFIISVLTTETKKNKFLWHLTTCRNSTWHNIVVFDYLFQVCFLYVIPYPWNARFSESTDPCLHRCTFVSF